ncbi:MAG: FCD domain-containing protein [Desulfobacteraceae bacterium]|nr:FCD domain-containing protein [Desulfobacteraceae bacterium]
MWIHFNSAAEIVDRPLQHIPSQNIAQSRAPKLLSKKRIKASIQSHVEIIDALKAREPDAAHDAMLRHLVEIEKN